MFSKESLEVVLRNKIDLPETSEQLTHWAMVHSGYKLSWQRRLIKSRSISLEDSVQLDYIISEWTIHIIKNFPETVRLKIDTWEDDVLITVANIRVVRLSAGVLLPYLLPGLCGDKVEIVVS